MKNYVGRKIRGFKFEDVRNNVLWFGYMENYIGEIGEITYENSVRVRVKFKDTAFDYPISLIEPHLIEECTCENINDTCDYCEVIQDSNILQDAKDKILTQKISGLEALLIVHGGWHGKEEEMLYDKCFKIIQQERKRLQSIYIKTIPKYTHAELVEKLGHDFEIIE
jgi:hypothetical protein